MKKKNKTQLIDKVTILKSKEDGLFHHEYGNGVVLKYTFRQLFDAPHFELVDTVKLDSGVIEYHLRPKEKYRAKIVKQ